MRGTLSDDDRQLGTSLALWSNGDLNVLSEGRQKLHEALDGEHAGLPTHQSGDVWLLDPEDLACPSLGQVAVLDEAIDSQREVRLKLLPLGIAKAQVGENITAAFRDAGFGFPCHDQFCLSP